jgi:hypothetical protein
MANEKYAADWWITSGISNITGRYTTHSLVTGTSMEMGSTA